MPCRLTLCGRVGEGSAASESVGWLPIPRMGERWAGPEREARLMCGAVSRVAEPGPAGEVLAGLSRAE